jgi:cell wall-associated NlpC family hydrolase
LALRLAVTLGGAATVAAVSAIPAAAAEVRPWSSGADTQVRVLDGQGIDSSIAFTWTDLVPPPVPQAAPAPVAGRVAPAAVAGRVAPEPVVTVLTFVRAQLGKPYIWGGTGPRGFDCSGLVLKAFAAVGVHLPRGSIKQSSVGTRVSRSQLQPGDLVFSNRVHHVQVYVGNGQVIAADRPRTLIRVSRLMPERLINVYRRIGLPKA